jgi:hypothetical protein
VLNTWLGARPAGGVPAERIAVAALDLEDALHNVAPAEQQLTLFLGQARRHRRYRRMVNGRARHADPALLRLRYEWVGFPSDEPHRLGAVGKNARRQVQNGSARTGLAASRSNGLLEQ